MALIFLSSISGVMAKESAPHRAPLVGLLHLQVGRFGLGSPKTSSILMLWIILFKVLVL